MQNQELDEAIRNDFSSVPGVGRDTPTEVEITNNICGGRINGNIGDENEIALCEISLSESSGCGCKSDEGGDQVLEGHRVVGALNGLSILLGSSSPLYQQVPYGYNSIVAPP